MNRIFSLIALGALSACAVGAQTTASGQSGATMPAKQMPAGAQANASGMQASGSAAAKTSASTSAKAGKASGSAMMIADGTRIDATLVSWLDARRSRVGDPVEARIEQDVKQGGKVVLKKGTRISGHVTEARARTKDQAESQVTIAFDRALIKNNQAIPFQASVVAMAAAPQPAAKNMTPSNGAMSATPASAHSSGSASSGSTSATASTTGAVMKTPNTATASASGMTNAAVRSPGAVGGMTSSGRMSSNSKGVFGLEGMSLKSASSKAAQGSMIVSSTKNVHVEGGTEMLLRTSSPAK
jgi:hypothetical protein